MEYMNFIIGGKVYVFKLTPKYPVSRNDDGKRTFITCAHSSPKGLVFYIEGKLYFYDPRRFMLMQRNDDTGKGAKWDIRNAGPTEDTRRFGVISGQAKAEGLGGS
jgi:hypothetical protein